MNRRLDQTTHILSVSRQMGKLHHLVAKLAKDLHKLLEGADPLQLVQRHQHLRGKVKGQIMGRSKVTQTQIH